MLSDSKIATLIALLPGPLSMADLSAAIRASDTTTSHFTTALRKAGLVAKDKRGVYSLTSVGRIHAMLYHGMVSGEAAIEENRDFWESHDLSAIPDELLADIGQLAGAKCIRDSPDAPMACQTAFVEAIRAAKELYGISGIIEPGYDDAILAALECGAHVELILTPWVIGQIDPDKLQAAKAYKTFRLYEMPDVKIAFTVTDQLISLALYDFVGKYDPWQDLMCDGNEAVRWGRRLFQEYKEKAKVVK